MRSVLLFADSLAFHGPERPMALSDPRLYPQVLAASLGPEVAVDVSARLGWTARDAWWALTRDPNVASIFALRADAVVLGVGQMDHLPAAIPTYLREGIAYVRPGGLRRRVRSAYVAAAPRVIKATGGPFRQLPQPATEMYLTRVVQAMRHLRPGVPAVLLGPSPHAATAYPSHRFHAPAVVASRRLADREGWGWVDLDPIVGPSLVAGTGNPDGMHWGWDVHDQIGRAAARELLRIGFAADGLQSAGGPEAG